LGVLGKLPASAAGAVIEDQLNIRRSHRLACAGAIENDIRHGLSTQHLGRALSHDPTHGIDDVGLTAAIGTDDSNQVAGKLYGGRIDKGFKTRQLDHL